MNYHKRLNSIGFLLLVAIGMFCSCNTAHKLQSLTYFQDFSDSIKEASVAMAKMHPLLIQADDIINITLQTTDPLASTAQGTVMNTTAAQFPISGGQSINTPNGTVTGFLVDKQGNVQLPLFGSVHLAGLSTDEAVSLIQQKSEAYYKHATVAVRFANLRVGILGEVNRPGYYNLPTEKNTILDALLYAGDLTIYGQRDNLTLMRDSAGIMTMHHFSLAQKDMLQSPYFYLKQNDVIYVQMNKTKVDRNLNTPIYTQLTIALSALTLLFIGINAFK